MAKYKIIGATGCATGIAHTYMAQEALEQAAKKMGMTIKIETHGQTGIEHTLTSDEIAAADAVVVASDINVDADRFAGKKVIIVPVARAIREPDKLIEKALSAETPIYKANKSSSRKPHNSDSSATNESVVTKIYTSLMNGVSHMLPLVVAGGVLIAVSFFWGIYSADPKSSQYNQFAYILNTIGSTTMNLMVPVLCAYIAEAISKRSGLIVGFATGMIAYNYGTGFIGAIVGGYLAGYIVILLQKLLKPIPDKEFRGLKAIFLYPVLGVFISGLIMYLVSAPVKAANLGMMDFLKGMQNADPIILGIIIGCMCAFDFGGPVNKAAYLTGTALLAQGNYYFMAGVSAACIAPPLATGFAVLMNSKAYSKNERSAGYVNFLLGSTHITEGAIPFAAKNPFLNIPAFMVGSSIAAVLSYMFKISDPAPHGGFIILPLVNHPFLWVLFILIGSIASGALLALIAGRQYRKHGGLVESAGGMDLITGVGSVDETFSEKVDEKHQTNIIEKNNSNLSGILNHRNVFLNVTAKDQQEVLHYLAKQAVDLGLASSEDSVFEKYIKREHEGSTGMENGIAIPHAQDDTIKKSSLLIVRLKDPVNWNTFDDKPVDTIISFLIPQKDNGTHLNYLSSTAKLLLHQDFVDRLKASQTGDQIVELFKQYKA
ncbi:MAG: fructose-specific PTS transporter subunit EIIC [Liquorilactobacillus nagelii]|mgnify:CR=1 FL=1|jgi:fructose-specific phosphotransferase system IIC component/fructose-specific phosphotransferase system IIA component/fructose-specific phosphotransferase system IIB component|uniref:fructose-specific PTS transporter subunit EIIC n=1 Tax=Liquorilactobacillus nagelii TaxID=82688 RepID=UPI0039EA4D29